MKYPCGGYVYDGKLTAKPTEYAECMPAIANEYAMPATATVARWLHRPLPNCTGHSTGSLARSTRIRPTHRRRPPLTVGTDVIFVNPTGVQVAGLGSPVLSLTRLQGTKGNLSCSGSASCQKMMIGTVDVQSRQQLPQRCRPRESEHQAYQRFGLIYQLKDASGYPLPSAVCLGAVAIEANIILATDVEMSSYTQNVPPDLIAKSSGPGE